MGTFIVCRTLSCMKLSSRLLHAIPEPSVGLFLGLCFFSALMMLGFIVLRSSHYDGAAQHRVDISVDHSKG